MERHTDLAIEINALMMGNNPHLVTIEYLPGWREFMDKYSNLVMKYSLDFDKGAIMTNYSLDPATRVFFDEELADLVHKHKEAIMVRREQVTSILN